MITKEQKEDELVETRKIFQTKVNELYTEIKVWKNQIEKINNELTELRV